MMQTTPTPPVVTRARARRPAPRFPLRSRFVAVLLALIGVAACDASTELLGVADESELDLSGAEIQIVSGNEQESEVGTVAPKPLVIRVVDAGGKPVGNAPIVWAFADGGGRAQTTSPPKELLVASTDDRGRAEVRWELGRKAGGQVALARIVHEQDMANFTDTTSIDSGDARTARFRASAAPGAPSEVSMSHQTARVAQGQAVELKAEIVDRFGNEIDDADVEWASSDEDVARVDSKGTVEAVAEGSADIVARAGSEQGVTTVTVDGAPLRVAVGPRGVTLETGKAARFDASIVDDEGRPVSGKKITWSTSDDDVLRIDATGLATGRAPGTAAVIATADGVSGEQRVTVVAEKEESDAAPDRVTTLRERGTTSTQTTLRWNAVDDGTGKGAKYAIRYGSPSVRWWAAHPTEVTVEADEEIGELVRHTIKGLEPNTQYQFQLVSYRGTLDQDAVFGALSNVAPVTTEPRSGSDPDPEPEEQEEEPEPEEEQEPEPDEEQEQEPEPEPEEEQEPEPDEDQEPGPRTVESIRVTPSSHTFSAPGETRGLTAVGLDGDGDVVEGAEFVFVSSNTSVVTVSRTGRMTAVAPGTARVGIGSTCCEAEAAVNVRVEAPESSSEVTSVTVTPTRRTFTSIGQTAQITATGRNGAGDVVEGAEFRYESTNSSIVSVDDMGRMRANASGVAAIIVSSICCSAQASIDVDVDVDDPPPSSGGAFYSESFDNGRANNANGFSWSGSPDVVRDVARSGSHSLKFSFGPTEPNGDSHWWTERRFNLGRNVTELWLEYYIYFPDGTEGIGSARYSHAYPSASNNNKFLAFWADSYQGEPLAIVEMWSTNSPNYDSNIRQARTEGNRDGDRDLIRRPGGTSGVGNNGRLISGNSDRGRWIQIRYHVKLADPGQNNGEFHLWKDGRLIIEILNDPFYDEARTHNYLRNGYLMGYDNGRFERNTFIYIDDLKFYSQRPNW